jgi:hypothetical protein
VTEDRLPVEYEVLKDVAALDLEVIDTRIETLDDNTHVEIRMKDDPDALESCAWGLIYAIGVLSFADARPRGSSEIDFHGKDEWYVADMLRHLTFVRGRLHFYADYVRGRILKTTVEIDKDGKILLETVNRGEAATRWIAKLQGKKLLALVGNGPPEQGPP